MSGPRRESPDHTVENEQAGAATVHSNTNESSGFGKELSGLFNQQGGIEWTELKKLTPNGISAFFQVVSMKACI